MVIDRSPRNLSGCQRLSAFPDRDQIILRNTGLNQFISYPFSDPFKSNKYLEATRREYGMKLSLISLLMSSLFWDMIKHHCSGKPLGAPAREQWELPGLTEDRAGGHHTPCLRIWGLYRFSARPHEQTAPPVFCSFSSTVLAAPPSYHYVGHSTLSK